LNWNVFLHVVEILVIAYLGFQQYALNERVNAEPAFQVDFIAELTQQKIYHIPHAHILIQPSAAYTIPEGFIHRLTIRNSGRSKATRVFVKNTISEGTLFRFAVVAMSDDATGSFVPEDDWNLHYVDTGTLKYLNVSLAQLRQGSQVSVFYAFASPPSERSGKEPNALTVAVDAAEIRTVDKPTPTIFPIWYKI